MAKLTYSEKQKMDSVFLWLVLAIAAVSNLWMIKYQDIYNEGMLIVSGIISITVTALFLFIRFDLSIGNDGISYRMRPFQRTQKLTYGDIQKYEIQEFKALRDYGGWGLRKAGKTTAYIMKGNKGVLLELKNGKKLLLGSQNPEKLFGAIQSQAKP